MAQPAARQVAATARPENLADRRSRALELVGHARDAARTCRHKGSARWLEAKRRGAEPKGVGLFGGFGSGNFGNDGSLESMLLFLRRVAPEQRLLCICGDPAAVEQAFGVDAIPIHWKPRCPARGRMAVLAQKVLGRATLWLHAVRHLRSLKVLIVPGTGLLDDFAVSPLGWPFDLLSWFLLARLMGVKVVLASIGAGPIRHPVSRWLMKSAARAAHYRSYRDTVSKTFMESIGFDARRDPVCPDLAFRLRAPPAIRRQRAENEPLTIGVGVMAYHGWRKGGSRGAEIYAAYLEKLTKFVFWLLNRGHVVRLLIGETSDLRAVEDLLRAVCERKPDLGGGAIVFAPAKTLHDVMQQMADTDVVVATRYHNIVCALRMAKPTVSIGYSYKNDALLAEMGLSDFCQHVEDFDVELLQTQTARLISDRAVHERRICDVQTQFEIRLSEQENLLASLIRSSRR
jgi:polysaccharide pyruvyl transferase WcaK-like protein